MIEIEKENVGLSSPWIEYYHKINALFKEDDEIECKFDDDSYTLKLYVDNTMKAAALAQLLPPVKEFGSVTVHIDVIPSNGTKPTKIDWLKILFTDNPIVSYFETLELFNREVNFVVFKKEVVQYFNDNLGDINGVESTLYQNIAKEVLEADDNTFYCTDVEDF